MGWDFSASGDRKYAADHRWEPAFDETKELVILPDDVHARFRKVEGERNLRGAEVVDGEQNLVWQESLVAPNSPADSCVRQAILKPFRQVLQRSQRDSHLCPLTLMEQTWGCLQN